MKQNQRRCLRRKYAPECAVILPTHIYSALPIRKSPLVTDAF